MGTAVSGAGLPLQWKETVRNIEVFNGLTTAGPCYLDKGGLFVCALPRHVRPEICALKLQLGSQSSSVRDLALTLVIIIHLFRGYSHLDSGDHSEIVPYPRDVCFFMPKWM